MSHPLLDHSADLRRLQEEGFEVQIRNNLLVITHVPYLNADKQVKFGTLISSLHLAGDETLAPDTHVVYFAGEYPCNVDGSPIEQITHQTQQTALDVGLTADHSFSNKPAGGYKDYYEKMATYIAILSSPAQSVDPSATANTFLLIEPEASNSVFEYIDTASGRAEINVATEKLRVGKVAIVGLGGTGSYVLDLVAKTPVEEIHLFDGDKFSQHNAFRSPGAPSRDDLRRRENKAEYFKRQYSQMRRNIFASAHHIDASTVAQLHEMNFVFLCLEGGTTKKLIVQKLEEFGISFIDVAMGVLIQDGSLFGQLALTTSTQTKRDHVWSRNRIAFFEDDQNNEYSRNIQIADLNALNASLAVVRWKKLCGFYVNLENEHYSVYEVDGNDIINEDQQ